MFNKISVADENNIEYQNVRRKKLKIILDKYFFSISALADKLDISRANLSTLISGTRPFSLYTANKIESSLALPYGYLSSETAEEHTLTDFISVKYYEDVKYLVGTSFEKKIKIPKEIIEQFKLNDNDNIIVTYMNDDLMYPTIKLREMIMVDTSQQKIEENKIYLININGFYRIRRLIVNNAMISVHIDNQDKKKTYIVNSFNPNDIEIVGKIVGLVSNLN